MLPPTDDGRRAETRSVPADRGRRPAHRDDRLRDRHLLPRRLDRRRADDRTRGRGRARDPRRHLRRLPALPRILLLMPRALETPHPVPNRLVPALAGTAVIVLALPVFALVGWPLGAWGLGAVLW